MSKNLFKTSFQVFQQACYKMSVEKGLHNGNIYSLQDLEAFRLLGLMHTEISEAMQEVKRHGINNGVDEKIAEELADTVIRIMDFAEHFKLDVSTAIVDKNKFNNTRPYQFGTPNSGEVFND
jgi:NTP pyrophosphatase (non-canonical NTP hydrolase)